MAREKTVWDLSRNDVKAAMAFLKAQKKAKGVVDAPKNDRAIPKMQALG